MTNYQDNMWITDDLLKVKLSVITDIGGREEQQDSFLYLEDRDAVLALICDGMGGYNGGKRAARTAVIAFEDAFAARQEEGDVPKFLLETIQSANNNVRRLRKEDPAFSRAGTTAVGVLVKDGSMHWVSVGDSRGYLIRGEEMLQFTLDQNYRTVLEEKKNAGILSEEEYAMELPRGDGLISFLGIDRLQLIDYSHVPLPLFPGDKVLLASDGLYRMVEEETIRRVLSEAKEPGEALKDLNHLAATKAEEMRLLRDNLTAVLLEVKA